MPNLGLPPSIPTITDPKKDFMVCIEELDRVLMQEENVICYEYQKLKENKNNYATHDLELATKVCILKLWRHYVTCRKFEL